MSHFGNNSSAIKIKSITKASIGTTAVNVYTPAAGINAARMRLRAGSSNTGTLYIRCDGSSPTAANAGPIELAAGESESFVAPGEKHYNLKDLYAIASAAGQTLIVQYED